MTSVLPSLRRFLALLFDSGRTHTKFAYWISGVLQGGFRPVFPPITLTGFEQSLFLSAVEHLLHESRHLS
jgi:hypothetical protein